MVYASHDGFRGAQIASGIHAAITGGTKGDMELRDMNEKEMRELDMWIAENVMGGWDPLWKPTENSNDAMAVLKKCAERLNGFELQIDGPVHWTVRCGDRTIKSASAGTLELAICKFAKELFSK